MLRSRYKIQLVMVHTCQFCGARAEAAHSLHLAFGSCDTPAFRVHTTTLPWDSKSPSGKSFAQEITCNPLYTDRSLASAIVLWHARFKSSRRARSSVTVTCQYAPQVRFPPLLLPPPSFSPRRGLIVPMRRQQYGITTNLSGTRELNLRARPELNETALLTIVRLGYHAGRSKTSKLACGKNQPPSPACGVSYKAG